MTKSATFACKTVTPSHEKQGLFFGSKNYSTGKTNTATRKTFFACLSDKGVKSYFVLRTYSDDDDLIILPKF